MTSPTAWTTAAEQLKASLWARARSRSLLDECLHRSRTRLRGELGCGRDGHLFSDQIRIAPPGRRASGLVSAAGGSRERGSRLVAFVRTTRTGPSQAPVLTLAM